MSETSQNWKILYKIGGTASVTHGLDLLHVLIIPFVPAVGASLMFVAGPLYLIWFPLLAGDFFRLAKE